MIQSFEWLLYAKKHPEFAEKMRAIIESGENTELRMNYLLLRFDGKRQVMQVNKADPDYVFNCKIVEVEVSYSGVKRCLDTFSFEMLEDDIRWL